MNKTHPNKILKILILGDAKVGKTTLRRRYLGEGFDGQYMTTLGMDFAVVECKGCQVQIWDLAGQEGFRKIIRRSYGGASGAILVYDVTNEESLINLANWMEEVQMIKEELIPLMFVGNKIDLREALQEHVKTEAAFIFVNSLAKKYKIDYRFIETSALTGQNITSAFEDLVDLIL